jgi:hypothetical protein
MKEVTEKLALFFVLGAVLINFPVLAIFDRATMIGGVPLLYLYVFGVWVIGIVAVLLLARKPWDEGA